MTMNTTSFSDNGAVERSANSALEQWVAERWGPNGTLDGKGVFSALPSPSDRQHWIRNCVQMIDMNKEPTRRQKAIELNEPDLRAFEKENRK